jgi:hypothetical protein
LVCQTAGHGCILGTDRNGDPIIWLPFDITSYIVVEINAFSCEYIGLGTITTDITSLNGFSYGDELQQNMIYSEPLPAPAPFPADEDKLK